MELLPGLLGDCLRFYSLLKIYKDDLYMRIQGSQ